MMKKLCRGIAARTLTTALLFAASGAGCLGYEEPENPVIDPDQQVAEAYKLMALFDGAYPYAPDPGEKAWAPETDLHAYPKLPGIRGDQRVTADAHAADVHAAGIEVVDIIAVETGPEGTKVTIYDPAPGVTPEALVADLRARGKQGVQIIRRQPDEVNQLAPNDCRFNNAVSFVCPVAYWRNNGLTNPVVYFNDHSGAGWPVSAAVSKWNQVVGIDSGYRWNSCPGRAGTRCVDVFSGNYGNVTWVGQAVMFFPTEIIEGPFRETGSYVQLNDFHDPGTRFTRNNVATHELGHVLGLGHNLWSGDVMWWVANRREDIGGENRTFLESLYSIAR